MFIIFLKLKASPYTQSLPYASLYFSEIAKFGGVFCWSSRVRKKRPNSFPLWLVFSSLGHLDFSGL